MEFNDLIISALVTGIFAFLGIVVGGILNNRINAIGLENAKRKDKNDFYKESARQLAEPYGELRRLLTIEDSGLDDPLTPSLIARHLAIFTAIGLSLADATITDQVQTHIWIPRNTHDDRGKVQAALAEVMRRLGKLITETSE